MNFTVTGEHLKLAKQMNVGWQDCKYGAPEIDPKRPYGNGNVALGIAEILGWKVGDEDELTEEQERRAREIHKQMATVLQIGLQVGEFRDGLYKNTNRNAPYGLTWELARG